MCASCPALPPHFQRSSRSLLPEVPVDEVHTVPLKGRGFRRCFRISGRGTIEPDASFPFEILTCMASSHTLSFDRALLRASQLKASYAR